MAQSDIQRAARLAAQRLEAMLVEMLAAGQVGTVAIEVLSPYELKPVKTVITEMPIVKVAGGRMTAIERVAT